MLQWLATFTGQPLTEDPRRPCGVTFHGEQVSPRAPGGVEELTQRANRLAGGLSLVPIETADLWTVRVDLTTLVCAAEPR